MGSRRRHILIGVAIAAALTVATGVGVVTLSDDAEPAAGCASALAVVDDAADVSEAPFEEGDEPVSEPSADLVELGVRGQKDGICVEWTTAEPVRDGTLITFIASGPFVENEAVGYMFNVELNAEGARVVRPPQTSDQTEPTELNAKVERSGATVSTFVPASEFTVPSFPYERFSFRSTLFFEPVGAAGYIDFVPDSSGAQLGYDEGRLCPSPCGDLALEQFRQPGPSGAPLPSPVEVTEAANEICGRADARLEKLARPQTTREIVRYADRAWPIVRAAVADFRSIEAAGSGPPGSTPPSLELFLAGLDSVSAELSNLAGSSPADGRLYVRGAASLVDELVGAMRIEAGRAGIASCEDMTIPTLVLPLDRDPPLPPSRQPPVIGQDA